MTKTYPHADAFGSDECRGLTVREHFAIQALTALVQHHGSPDRYVYRSELPRDEKEQTWHKAWRDLAALNRQAVCMEALALADQLIITLNERPSTAGE